MNDQQTTNPIVTPTQTQPSPPSVTKHYGWKWGMVIVLIIIIGGLWYLYSRGSSSTTITFDDSDLRISYTEISSLPENSAPVFNTLKNSPIAKEDMDILTKYISDLNPANLPPVTEASKIISKYQSALKIFDENATKPYRCDLMNGEECALANLRGLAYLAGVKALVLFQQGKTAEAQKTVSDLINLGRNLTAQADVDISLLIGWIIQKTGYSVLSIVNAKKPTPTYTEAEKNDLITNLRNEQKKVFQYGYTRIAEGIDYITSPEKIPHEKVFPDMEEYVNEYRKVIAENPKAWNPEETKRYFYESFRIMISNTDLACGATLPESKIETNFDPNDQTTENYIGQTLYNSAYSGMNSINIKRCEVEQAIKNL